MYVLSNGTNDTLCNLRRTSIPLSVLNGFRLLNFFKIIGDSTKRNASFLMYLFWGLNTANGELFVAVPLV
jgi:hypothetical protein